MRLLPSLFIVTVLCGMAAVFPAATARSQPAAEPGGVSVSGKQLIRDGHVWLPHGFHQIAFVLPPGVPPTKPFFLTAAQNYSPHEYVEMREAGADSVRIQVSQPGADPNNPRSQAFRHRVIGAVRAARAAGLTVIVSIQDEPQSGEAHPAKLPNATTRQIWQKLAPELGHDRGVLFELLNEPHLPPSPQHWQAWAEAMNETIRTVREAGAVNVVVADGLAFGEQLTGAPRLNDPLKQVAYASHPYAHSAADQNDSAWDLKFGNFARTAPVIITEWSTGYYCDRDTPASVLSFLKYLQARGIGIEAAAWDWSPPHFGSAVYNFPDSHFSSFGGQTGPLSCKDAGFGFGQSLESWYRTGVPPASIQ